MSPAGAPPLGRCISSLSRRGYGSSCPASSARSASTTAVLPTLLEPRSEEHTSELQSLMRISYAVFCLKKKNKKNKITNKEDKIENKMRNMNTTRSNIILKKYKIKIPTALES